MISKWKDFKYFIRLLWSGILMRFMSEAKKKALADKLGNEYIDKLRKENAELRKQLAKDDPEKLKEVEAELEVLRSDYEAKLKDNK